jgi:hypothetical protein
VVDYAGDDDVHWDGDDIEPDDGWGVVFASGIVVRCGFNSGGLGVTYGLRISHITVTKACYSLSAWIYLGEVASTNIAGICKRHVKD